MQVIHAETEQTYENAVAKLVVDRMLNHIRELELNTTDIVGNEKANEMMNARPELEINNCCICKCKIPCKNIDSNLEKINGNYSLKIILYEIKNEDNKSKSATGDAAAERMATNR